MSRVERARQCHTAALKAAHAHRFSRVVDHCKSIRAHLGHEVVHGVAVRVVRLGDALSWTARAELCAEQEDANGVLHGLSHLHCAMVNAEADERRDRAERGEG